MAVESTGVKEMPDNGRVCFIIGRAGSGKTTLAQMVSTATGLTHLETGDVVGEHLARFHLRAGASGYRAGSNKSLWREELEAMGDVICDVKRDYLWTTCVNRGGRIITGLRRASEMASAWQYSVMHPLIVLVKSAADYVGDLDRVWELEDFDKAKPCIVVRNDGNVTKLAQAADMIALELAAL